MPAAKKVAKIASTPTETYVTTLLRKISEGKHVMSVRKGEKIFSQGDRADSIYFVQTGRVKVSVVSSGGKEAVLAMLGPHHFFGEGALFDQSLRVSTATAVEPATLFQVERRAMLRALHDHAEFSEKFMALLLARNIDLEEDLCDQLFNHSERRLARVLLKLARLPEYEVVPDATRRKLSHETLAEMVGTTRSRITHFMNKFRKMGLIKYDGGLEINRSLLSLVLHE
jgi:CRP-like cAMP-binding protein